jgi:hypothetical protein
MSAYFTNSLTPPTGLGLLAAARGGFFPGRAARGSVAPRKMACRPAAGGVVSGSRPSARARGQPGRCPFLVENKREAAMDAKTRNLTLLAGLSLFCAGVAWISDHFVLGSVFFAFGAVAAYAIAERHWR